MQLLLGVNSNDVKGEKLHSAAEKLVTCIDSEEHRTFPDQVHCQKTALSNRYLPCSLLAFLLPPLLLAFFFLFKF